MLLVKTKLGPSTIAGIGLFAAEFIPQGTYTWKFIKGFDMRFPNTYPESLPEPAKSFFFTYAYQIPKTLNYVLCADNARFANHSETPNILQVEDPEDEDTASIAARDINEGEELTVDYREFDTDPYHGIK